MKEYPKDKLSVAEDREPFHAGSKPHMHDDLDSSKCTYLSSINRAAAPPPRAPPPPPPPLLHRIPFFAFLGAVRPLQMNNIPPD